MPKDRFFLDQDLKKNNFICISGKEATHIHIIMRKKINDIVEIINGNGFLAASKIVNISKGKVELKIENLIFEKEKKQKIILLQSIIKPDKLDLILEKCTELGISEFWLFNSKNSLKVNFSKNRSERMQNIIISATKQCGRLYLPTFKFIKSIKEINKIDGQVFLGDTKKNASTLIKSYKKDAKNICMIIGPESGFIEEETLYFENMLKAKKVKLNDNILRSETAAISSISILSHLLQF